MARKVYTEETIADIAAAIRDKNGLTDTYTTSEMPTAIRSLIWEGTQSEYDALIYKNPTTLYIIVEADT